MDSIAENSSVKAVACLNPFTMKRVDRLFVSGMTISEMLADLDFPAWVEVLVFVDGDIIPKEMHAHYMPRPSQFVAFRAVPSGGGGGGKNPLRTVLALVVMVAAAYTGNYVGVQLGYGMLAGAAATVAVGAVGSLLVNAIAPPPKPAALAQAQSYTDSPSYSISGGRNVLVPYGPIPQILGRARIWPHYAVTTYTEIQGDDQYLICYFKVSKGQTIISELKIGETLLSEYAGVEYEIFDGSVDTESTLYPGDVYQEDLSVVLTQAGGWVTRTTAPNTIRISADVTYPRGLVSISDAGRRSPVLSQVEMQYGVAGSGSWLGSITGSVVGEQEYEIDALTQISQQNCLLVMHKITGALSLVKGEHWLISTGMDDAGNTWDLSYGNPALYPTAPDWAFPLATFYAGGNDFADARTQALRDAGYFAPSIAGTTITIAAGTLFSDMFVTTGKTTSSIRRSFAFPVAAGQYDVRVRRVSADTDDDQIFDEVAWTALRSFQSGSPVLETGLSRVVLRIKATDQLNGPVDAFNCIAQILCPDYDTATGTWIERATSNPASLYRYVLQGPANHRPLADAAIDLDILEDWHDRCREQGWTFNLYVDYRSSVDDLLQMIAAAGRAAPGYVDGKYAVVMDRPQTNIRGHFTPRNTWDFSYKKVFVDIPHAFRVKFRNSEAGWLEDERIVYDDGYSAANATKIEELNWPGIDTPRLAWIHGRFQLACLRLRPESSSWMNDFEHLTCTRGDLVRFNNDVIYAGLGYGRVKSYTSEEVPVNVLTITLDSEVTMEAGQSYGLRIRQDDGTSLSIALTTVAGISRTVTVSGLYPVATYAPDTGALAMFGLTGQESLEFIVKSIEPSGDLTAGITCLPYAPAVHTSDVGPIPAFETKITRPPARYQLYVPVIERIRSDESVMIVYPSGDLVPQIAITFSAQNIPAGLIDRTQVRYRIAGTGNPYSVAETIGSEIFLGDVTEGESYNIEARYFLDGQWGKWCAARQHAVVGQSSIPADVTNFRINILGDVAFLSWTAVDAIDLAGYRIKYSTLTTGATWTGATTLGAIADRTETSAIRTALNGTYLIKAIDQSGRESAAATSIVNTAAASATMNVVETLDEAPAWAGVNDRVIETDGALMLAYQRDIFGVDDFFSVNDVFLGTEGHEPVGYYAFASGIDLGAVYVSRVSGSLEASGVNQNEDIFSRSDFFGVDDVFGVTDSNWNAEIEMRMTDDDPAGSPTWSGWAPLALGDYSARAFEFRIRLESLAWGVTPAVSAASVSVDMPDRIVSGNDLTVPVAGLSVVFGPAFKGLKGLGIAAQDMATGDYSVVSSKGATGFDVIFRNAAGAAVQRTMDYVAAGYGRVIV